MMRKRGTPRTLSLVRHKALSSGCAALFAVCSQMAATAAENAGVGPSTADRDASYTFSLNLDNDFFAGTDSSYTNGVRAVWSRPLGPNGGPNPDIRLIEGLLPWEWSFGYSNQIYNNYGGGSSIFTPEDTSALNPPADQRPYASYLYFLSGLEAEQVDLRYQPRDAARVRIERLVARDRRARRALANELADGTLSDKEIENIQNRISRNFQLSTRHHESYEVQLGWMGPHAYGEEILETFHSIWPAGGNAVGWQSRQIKDEPVVNVFYNRVWTGFPLPQWLESSEREERRWQKRLYENDPIADRHTPPRPLSLGPLALDFRPHAGGALGNLYTFGAVGTMARLGFNIPDNIGPPLIRPALPGSDHFTRRNLTKTAVYGFAGVDSRLVLHNATLDGNLFRESPSVDKKYLVHDAQVGVALEISALRVSYGRVYRTEEFDGQGDTSFGAVNVGLNFEW